MPDSKNAGPTTGAIAETAAGQQVIADEAAAQGRVVAPFPATVDPGAPPAVAPSPQPPVASPPKATTPKKQAAPKEPPVPIGSHHVPHGTIRIWRWPDGKGVFANKLFFENGVVRIFVFVVKFTGPDTNQFTIASMTEMTEEKLVAYIESLA